MSETELHLKHMFRQARSGYTSSTLAAAVGEEIDRLEREATTLRVVDLPLLDVEHDVLRSSRMASSTTKPTAMASAISEMLSRLNLHHVHHLLGGRDQGQRHRHAGMTVAQTLRSEHKHRQHDQADGDRGQSQLDIGYRVADIGRAVGHQIDMRRPPDQASSVGIIALI